MMLLGLLLDVVQLHVQPKTSSYCVSAGAFLTGLLQKVMKHVRTQFACSNMVSGVMAKKPRAKTNDVLALEIRA